MLGKLSHRAYHREDYMPGNTILRLEANERYLRMRLDSITGELLLSDHPLVEVDKIQIDQNGLVTVPFDVYLEDTSVSRHTFMTAKGEHSVKARPMFAATLTVQSGTGFTAECNTDNAPAILESMRILGNDLVLELLDGKITLHLNPHPHAVLEISDHPVCYEVKEGVLFYRYVHDPWNELA
jgi:L-arabinose isomerase